MAEPFATPGDLTARWRALTLEETDRATTLLLDASSKMRSYCRSKGRNLDATIASADPDVTVDDVKRIACAIVKRGMKPPPENVPDGTGQMQQNAGPFSQGFTFSNPSGDLYLSKAEKLELTAGLGKAYTIDTAPRGTSHSPVCSLYFGAGYCSCGADLTLSGPLYET